VIRGTWVDSGTLTAIKTLYFDGGAWVLNGCKFSARSEQWDGEWLYLAPTYSGLTSTGEGYKIDPSKNDDKVNYTMEAVAELNGAVDFVPEQVLEYLVNDADGAPSSQPTLNTRWEVMLQYTDSTGLIDWHIQEHNSPVTYTAGSHTITNGYELILCDSSGGTVNVDLPDPTLSKGKKYYFKKLSTNHTVVITGGGADIDGSTTLVLNQLYQAAQIICDGVQWWVI
jgi:hypothetical protein